MTAHSCPRKFLVSRNFPLPCPNCFALQHPGKCSRHCAHPFPGREEKVVLILTRHHFQHALLTHDAQARQQYEPHASDFTIRSLPMIGPTHFFFALYVSVCQSSHRTFQVNCPETQPYLGPCLQEPSRSNPFVSPKQMAWPPVWASERSIHSQISQNVHVLPRDLSCTNSGHSNFTTDMFTDTALHSPKWLSLLFAPARSRVCRKWSVIRPCSSSTHSLLGFLLRHPSHKLPGLQALTCPSLAWTHPPCYALHA